VIRRIGSLLSIGAFKGLSELLLSQVVSIAASLLVTFATAEMLGPAGRGQLAFIMGVANLGGAIAYGSLHVGVTYAHKTGDPSALKRCLRLGAAASFLTILVGVSVAAISVAVSGEQQRAVDLMVGTAGAALVSFNLVVLRVRQGLGDARNFRVAWSIQSGIYAAAGIPVAFLFRSATAVVGCWFIGLIVSTIYGLRGFYRPTIGLRRHVSARSILATSWAAHLGFIGFQFLYRADIVILAFFVIPAQLGVYSIAAPTAELTWIVSEALSLLAFSHYRANQSVAERVRQRGQLLKLNLATGLLGGLGVAIIAWAMVPVLLPRYAEAVPLIFILLPGVIIQGAARIAFSTLVSTGASRPAILVGLISVALCVIYLPFCYRWGVTGAALASTTIYIAQATVVFMIVRRADRIQELSDVSSRP
jgi:O-antigen/teichoic acid export membrane protein